MSVDFVEPIDVEFFGHRIHELPPNGQGIAALIALGILERLDIVGLPPDSPELLHLEIEAMKLGVGDVRAHVADPAFMTDRAGGAARSGAARRSCQFDPARPRRRADARVDASRRDRLSRRRRPGRHDGLLHPVELSRLRLRHCRAGDRDRAQQPRLLLRHRLPAIRTASARRSGRSTPSSPASSRKTASRSSASA